MLEWKSTLSLLLALGGAMRYIALPHYNTQKLLGLFQGKIIVADVHCGQFGALQAHVMCITGCFARGKGKVCNDPLDWSKVCNSGAG